MVPSAGCQHCASREPGAGSGCTEPQRHGDILVHRSFSYTDSYNGDIRFDNVYISTYFCQIDERRKKLVCGPSPLPTTPPKAASCGFALQAGRGERGAQRSLLCAQRLFQGKRTLLPLRKAERKTVIFPYDPTIQASEMKNVVRMGAGLPGEEASTAGRGRWPAPDPRLLGR